MKYTRAFKELNRNDASIAGGKGASLGEMLQSGIPVPDGFVVLASTFDGFLKETDLVQEVESILSTVKHDVIHTVESASEQIRTLIESKEMPEDIKEEILNQFKNLDAQFVAVRSSATAEDGVDHAWAGQLESYLNTTEETLLAHVKHCWASLFTPRAIFYRFEKKLHATDISVAVVVQKMIQSEVSGIAFSVHPITEDPNQLIIEAGFGLGEAIVSGSITPDSYVVEKSPRKIIDVNVNTQTKGLFGLLGGGNEWKNVEEPKASSQVLNTGDILELAELVMKIENHYGFPCDIEWAYEGGKFYIVQSRPITTLTKKDFSEELDFSKYTMIPQGKRRTNILDASLKIQGRSLGLEKEIGVGYNAIVINSLGEQFVDHESRQKIVDFLNTQTFKDIQKYIQKMADLNAQLQKKVEADNSLDYTEGFEKLYTYFFIARYLSEYLFATLSVEEQQYIEEWRNNPDVFSSLALYEQGHPDSGEEGEWSWVIFEGVTHFVHKNIRFIKENKEQTENSNEIKGIVGYPGIVQGKVRVVLSAQDIRLVEEGEVIVAPMTTVDFGAAMKKAVAFVTDEGGVTSHAAIIAREMKKPCILRTKIGTQILKTSDMVEVDADKGIVRILKSNSDSVFPSLDNYQRLFKVGGLRFFMSSIWMRYYEKLNVLVTFSEDNFTSYLPKNILEKTLEDGFGLLSSKEKFEKFDTDFREYIREGDTFAQSLDFDNLSKDEVMQLVEYATGLYPFYSHAEFFYTDKAFMEVQESKNDDLKKNIKKMESFKNDGREFLSRFFFGSEAYLNKLLNGLSRSFSIPVEKLRQYGYQEIYSLFDGIFVSKEIVDSRNKAFYILGKGQNSIIKWGDEALIVIERFNDNQDLSKKDTITGVTAHRGKSTGLAFVMLYDGDNFDLTAEKIKNMNPGDILIAETTSPELLVACKKASAIVTDQGGQLSHAAIVSRELGIPCIVGTGNATSLIQTGDMVEVDANNGTIRILSKTN